MRNSSKSYYSTTSVWKSPEVVFVNGCFDILHRGHIALLTHAKTLGDSLIVGIDSDNRVSKLKGDSRPVNSQEDRRFLLEALGCVDKVYIFNSEEELKKLILNVQATTMIVGEEYKGKRVVGYRPDDIKLHYFPKIDGYSTTTLIEHTPHR